MTMLFMILGLFAVAYVGACLMLYVFQAAYMYAPDRAITATPADVGLPFENVTLVTADGARLGAWFVPAPAPQRADLSCEALAKKESAGAGPADTPEPWTWLYCHGNAGNLSGRVDVVRRLHDLGFAVLIFDYRGYGVSTGAPDEAGTYEDARAAWQYLTATRGIRTRRILVYGHSMGGAVAVWLAQQVHPAALVIDAAFTSALDMGAAMFPYLPVRRLSRFHYNNLDRIAHVGCPVFIAHGVADTTIPVEHGRRLFARAVEPKQYAEFVGDHDTGGFDPQTGYRDKLTAWLRAIESSGR